MKSKNNSILVLMMSGMLAACGTATQKAPIEDRTTQNQTASTLSSTSKLQQGQSHYTVKKGDTLYRIALEKGQNYSDLVIWNNLANPDDIKVGQMLRVTPPDTGTSVVAVPNGIDVRPLGTAIASVASLPSSNNKHSPRADKRPYSDIALAELQKSEITQDGNGNIANVAPVKNQKPAEKASDTVQTSDIVWTWPVEGKVSSQFENNKNKGIDVLGKPGQHVYAAAAGTVIYAGSGIPGYGNLVIIRHTNHFLSAYAHNQSILVKEKQVISKGQKIAEMGKSDSDVVKLHFEIRQQGRAVDPMKFLPAR